MNFLLMFAACVTLLITLGLFDMAVGVAKRHGFRYAAGEFMAAGVMLALSILVLLLGSGAFE